MYIHELKGKTTFQVSYLYECYKTCSIYWYFIV